MEDLFTSVLSEEDLILVNLIQSKIIEEVLEGFDISPGFSDKSFFSQVGIEQHQEQCDNLDNEQS